MVAEGVMLVLQPHSEISETASDAWSTDVLASDTDEKNSERLRELEDQVVATINCLTLKGFLFEEVFLKNVFFGVCVFKKDFCCYLRSHTQCGWLGVCVCSRLLRCLPPYRH